MVYINNEFKEIKESAKETEIRKMREKKYRSIKNKAKRDMKNLGVYHKSYDTVIETYANLLYQYSLVENEFYNNGSKITEKSFDKNGNEVEKKTATYLALESLRKDILNYSNQLGLNPKGKNVLKNSNAQVASEFEEKIAKDLEQL